MRTGWQPRYTGHGCFITLLLTEVLLCLMPRYSFAGIFWFTLFHEIAHILKQDLQYKFIDYDNLDSEEEYLADEFAKKVLIDSNEWIHFVNLNDFSLASINAFSEKVKVPPFIVIERLQKEHLIPYNRYTNEKVKYKWD